MSNLDTSTQAILRCAQALQDAAQSLPVRFVRGLFVVNLGGTDQVGLVANDFNKINFSTKVADQDNWFDAVTNFRYTPQLPGLYLFHLNVTGSYGLGNDQTQAVISQNGGRVAQGTYINISAPNTLSVSVVTAVVKCNGTTDYVEGFGYIPVAPTAFKGGTQETYMFGLRLTGL